MSNSTTLFGSAALTYAYEIGSLRCLRNSTGAEVATWAEANRLAESGDLVAHTEPAHPYHADAMAEVEA